MRIARSKLDLESNSKRKNGRDYSKTSMWPDKGNSTTKRIVLPSRQLVREMNSSTSSRHKKSLRTKRGK